MRNDRITIEGSVLSRGFDNTSTVVKNTYLLLSVTLVWSAICSMIGTSIAWSGFGMIACVIGGFATLFATMKFRNSGWGLVSIFAFAGIEGLTLGPVLTHYLAMVNGASIVTEAIGMTAVITFALSAYAIKSGRDFSRMGGFLFAGLITVLIASIAAIFFPVMQTAVAGVSALLFSAFILYDTSRIVRGEEDNYIMAAMSVYLNILNLFLDMLRLIAEFRD